MASKGIREKLRNVIHGSSNEEGRATTTSPPDSPTHQMDSPPNYSRPLASATTEDSRMSGERPDRIPAGVGASSRGESEALKAMYPKRNWSTKSNDPDRPSSGIPERPKRSSEYYDRVRNSNAAARQPAGLPQEPRERAENQDFGRGARNTAYPGESIRSDPNRADNRAPDDYIVAENQGLGHGSRSTQYPAENMRGDPNRAFDRARGDNIVAENQAFAHGNRSNPYNESNDHLVRGEEYHDSQQYQDVAETMRGDSNRAFDRAPNDYIVDLSNSTNTTVHERWAPAVTHETIVREDHEIREEHIERDIHEHHVYHRILPIKDVQVLPARHFVHDERGSREVSESQIPGRAHTNADRVIAQAFSSDPASTEGNASYAPRQFTARPFHGADGDYREGIAPEGHVQSETTWVHPPTLQTGGMETGQTEAFHFNSPNPNDDGLRTHRPSRRSADQRPVSAEQQRELIGLQHELHDLQGQSRGGNRRPISAEQKQEVGRLQREIDDLVGNMRQTGIHDDDHDDDDTLTPLQKAQEIARKPIQSRSVMEGT